MTITFTNAPTFTTTITANEILISPIGGGASTIATTPVNRLGYTTEFGNTATWQNPIWFRFYEPTTSNVALGILRNFQAVDIETAYGASFTSDDVNKMLSIMFANYYNTSAGLKADILTSVPLITNIFERLNGDTPTTTWQTACPPINTSFAIKAIALFQDYGIGFTPSYNLNYAGETSIGTMYKEVHLTAIDPLADPNLFPAKYRYLMSTEEQILSKAGSRRKGLLIYTNLFNEAFSSAGMLHYFQFLAIWPMVARIIQQIQDFSTNYTPIAYINSLMDSTILQKGLGYFDRSVRINTTNGWFGNPLFSFCNSFRLTGATSSTLNTIVAPFIGYSEYGIMKNMEATFATTDALPFSDATPCIWSGENPAGNFAQNSAKAYVRLIMYFTACIERVGSTTAKPTVIDPTEANIVSAYSLTNVSEYYQDCANQLAVGEYAHFFRYAQTVVYEGSTVFDTFVAPYISSWSASISSLQLIALDNYSANLASTLLSPISNLSTYYANSIVGPYRTAMDASEENNLTLYTYP